MQVHLLLDVGGTKMAWAIGTTHRQILYQDQQPTCLGITNIKRAFADIIQRARDYCHSAGYDLNAQIRVAFPGCHHHGIIAPGSAENLGTYPGEWDNTNLHSLLPTGYSMFVINDAIAQFLGGLLLSPPPKHVHRVGYIGPGTGLGGGFANRSKDGWTLVTNGHIFDIAINSPFGRIMAESLFSARGVRRMFHIEAHQLTQDYLEKHAQLTLTWCKAFCQFIQKIHLGTFNKVALKTEFSYFDYQHIRSVDYFFIGGSILTKSPLGIALKRYWDTSFQSTSSATSSMNMINNTEYASFYFLCNPTPPCLPKTTAF